MRFTPTFVALVAPYLVSAAPARFYGKRAAIDVTVFKFADVLEQLESTFYQEALARFQEPDFISAGFTTSQIPIEQFKKIQTDEATHSAVLQAALRAFGEEPITSCKFNFASGLTDVATMAATARIVENVGVAAYSGGAILLTDPVLLGAAASILTVEARHQTVLNILSGGGTAIPAAFDIALTPSEVLALASPFIDGPCDLGIPANPTLSVTNTGSVGPGTLLTFSAEPLNDRSPDGLFCQMLVGGATAAIPLPLNECVVPDGINGPVAIFVTTDGQPLINNVRDRASTQLLAGPTLAFIDTQPELLGQLVRGPNAAGSQSGVTTTRTIGPEEASSIIAGAAPTDSTPASTSISLPAPTDSAPASTSASLPAAAESPVPTSSAPATNQAAAAAAAPVPGTPGGPSTFTGLSSDGFVTVNGWANA